MNITESFEWMTPEFKIVDAGKNTIRIKGVAMKSDVVSRNKRKYIDEELIKSARTFIGKPVTINHDMTRIVGDIKWMEYNDGALEYLADIKKQPYVKLLRDGSAEIKGVSIEANYLHNRCSKCGERFYTEEDFHSHMAGEHFIKTDPTSEPHGIIGQALSLVLSPEQPGYTGTSIQLMELYRKPVLRLLETVTNTKIEKENYMKKLDGKAVLSTDFTKTVAELQEQEEDHGCAENETWDGEKCVAKPEATEQEDGAEPPAHPTEDGGHECEEGSHWDEVSGTCVPDEIPAEPDKVIEQEAGLCAPGFHDDGAGNCLPDAPIPEVDPPTNAPQITPEPEIEIPKVDVTIPAPVEQPPLDVTQTLGEQAEDNLQPVPHPVEAGGKECPIAGTHYDEVSGTCIPDVFTEDPTGGVEPPTTKVVVEVRLPKLLKLGEPVDEHGCHHDEEWNGEKCVKKEPVSETMNIYETVKRLDRRALIRDVQLAETLNTQNRALAKVVNAVNKLPRQLTKPMVTESRLRAKYDRQNVAFLKENVKATNTNTNIALKKLSRSLTASINKTGKTLSEQSTANLQKSNQSIVEQTNKQLKGLGESVNKLSTFINKKLSQLATDNRKLRVQLNETTKYATKVRNFMNSKVTGIKRDYEKILEAASKVSTVKIRTLEQRLKEQDDELEKRKCGENEYFDEEQDKCVPKAPKEEPATEETKKKLTETLTRLDNLEAKMKGKFKGNAKSLTEQASNSIVVDPLKTKKKGRTKNA